jgi:hypothetical protein
MATDDNTTRFEGWDRDRDRDRDRISMPSLASAKSYCYRMGIGCLQLFQLPRVPGFVILSVKYYYHC